MRDVALRGSCAPRPSPLTAQPSGRVAKSIRGPGRRRRQDARYHNWGLNGYVRTPAERAHGPPAIHVGTLLLASPGPCSSHGLKRQVHAQRLNRMGLLHAISYGGAVLQRAAMFWIDHPRRPSCEHARLSHLGLPLPMLAALLVTCLRVYDGLTGGGSCCFVVMMVPRLLAARGVPPSDFPFGRDAAAVCIGSEMEHLGFMHLVRHLTG